jgi:hypothetical protein
VLLVNAFCADEAALKAGRGRKGRCAPPVHMIKLTQEREITPYTRGATMIGVNGGHRAL